MVTYPYAHIKYIVSALAGLGGGISWRPPAYSLFLIMKQNHGHITTVYLKVTAGTEFCYLSFKIFLDLSR